MSLKKTFSFLLSICVINLVFSHSSPNSNSVQNFKKMGLVWGLLKYHHPDISDGKYDWDAEFIKLYAKIEGLEESENADSVLLEFVEHFETNGFRIDSSKDSGLFVKNYDYQWIEKLISNVELKELLHRLKENKNIGDYYTKVSSMGFVKFSNEKGMSEFNLMNSSHRLLFLVKFWNVIQYWYPNKFLASDNWVGILDEYLPEFLHCESDFQFELLKCKLFAELNDSHTFFYNKTVIDSLFSFRPHFSVTNVNDSLVVNYLVNQKKCEQDDIKLGDVIITINGKPIKEALDTRLSSLVSVSNPSFLKFYSNYLVHSGDNEINVEMIRNGKLQNRLIHLSKELIRENPLTNEGKHSAVEKLRKDVFYLNLSKLTKKTCDSFFKTNQGSIENLVIDLRWNVQKDIGLSDMTNYLVNDRRKFVKVLAAVNAVPSIFDMKDRSGGIIGTFIDAYTTGKKSKTKYVEGKVILIVNRRTQSRGEYFGMGIQQAENCVTIGQQTAGSPMNITSFVLPDESEVQFTSMTGFYPNSELAVQKNGLEIDYFVPLSTYEYHSDQYIDFALKIIDK